MGFDFEVFVVSVFGEWADDTYGLGSGKVERLFESA